MTRKTICILSSKRQSRENRNQAMTMSGIPAGGPANMTELCISCSVTTHKQEYMRNRGVTLIEIVIVVAIISILAVALGFTYQGWLGPYRIERATKDLYSDLMSARSVALTQDRMLFATFIDANNYSVIADTNDSKTLNVGDLPLPTYPKLTNYAMNWAGAVPANQSISFDKRGIINVVGAAAFPVPDPVISFTSPAGVDPDYDCIVISQIRIKMGKMIGGNCNAK